MENRTAEYNGKGEFKMLNNGKTRVFNSSEFWEHCLKHRIMPSIQCYNTKLEDIEAVRKRKSELVEALNSN